MRHGTINTHPEQHDCANDNHLLNRRSLVAHLDARLPPTPRCFCQCCAFAETWKPVAALDDRTDGLIYSGSEFIAYRLAPTLTLYRSSNATNWLRNETAITPLCIGHDGHGKLYAVSDFYEDSFIERRSIYSALLWREDAPGVWSFVAKLELPWNTAVGAADIVASGDLLLMRIPIKSATDSDFGRTVIPVSSDTCRSGATLDVLDL